MKGRLVAPMRLGGSFRYVILAVVAVFVVFGAVSAAHAQESDLRSLLNRMERMQRDIRTLNQQLAQLAKGNISNIKTVENGNSSESDLRRILASFEVRLGTMEDELRTSTGRSEELGHQISQLNQRLDKLVGDVDYRLGVIEKATRAASGGNASSPATPSPNMGGAPSSAGGQPVAPGPNQIRAAAKPGVLGAIAPSEIKGIKPPMTLPGGAAQAEIATPASVPASGVLPPGSAKEQYTYARKLLIHRQFDKAEIALREFVKVNSNDPLLSNARYWLGETYYVRGNFRSAAKAFMQGYKEAPKGAKAPDTLLKLGMSLSRLDKKQDACIAFTKLTDEFPSVSPRIAKIVARERKSNSCN